MGQRVFGPCLIWFAAQNALRIFSAKMVVSAPRLETATATARLDFTARLFPMHVLELIARQESAKQPASLRASFATAQGQGTQAIIASLRSMPVPLHPVPTMARAAEQGPICILATAPRSSLVHSASLGRRRAFKVPAKMVASASTVE